MFTPKKCHVSHVTCHVSRVTCHMSHVTCHLIFLKFNFILIFFLDKVVKLIVGGSIINGAYPVQFLHKKYVSLCSLLQQVCKQGNIFIDTPLQNVIFLYLKKNILLAGFNLTKIHNSFLYSANLHIFTNKQIFALCMYCLKTQLRISRHFLVHIFYTILDYKDCSIFHVCNLKYGCVLPCFKCIVTTVLQCNTL